MSSQYTPGPWTTDCQDHDAPYQNIKVKSGYRNICTVWIDDAPVRDYNAEQEANARLIAAAPELLEALKKVREDVNWMTNSGKLLNRFVFNYLDEAIASATIAKAAGGQS